MKHDETSFSPVVAAGARLVLIEKDQFKIRLVGRLEHFLHAGSKPGVSRR